MGRQYSDRVIEAQVISPSMISVISTTTYTLSERDKGMLLRFTHASGCAVTVPATLPVGFSCGWLQWGAAQVSFVESSTEVRHPDNHTKSAKLYASGGLTHVVDNEYLLTGNTAV